MGQTHTSLAWKSATITGSTAGDLTVTGIKVTDRLLTAVDVSAADADLVDEFTISAADTINNVGGTDTTGMVLLVQWIPSDVRGGDLNEA